LATAALIKSEQSEYPKISRIIPHLCGIPECLREKRLVVALRAFFDESATSSKDGPFLIMAGYVGAVEEFEDASNFWHRHLKASPSVQYFHHKDGSSQGKILPLAEVIGSHDLQGFVITMPHAPFCNRDSSAAKGMFGSRVYDWAFVYAVSNVLGWVNAIVMEDNARLRRELEKFHEDETDIS